MCSRCLPDVFDGSGLGLRACFFGAAIAMQFFAFDYFKALLQVRSFLPSFLRSFVSYSLSCRLVAKQTSAEWRSLAPSAHRCDNLFLIDRLIQRESSPFWMYRCRDSSISTGSVL